MKKKLLILLGLFGGLVLSISISSGNDYIYKLFDNNYKFKQTAFRNNSISQNILKNETIVEEKIENGYINLRGTTTQENIFGKKTFTQNITTADHSTSEYTVGTLKYLKEYINSKL